MLQFLSHRFCINNKKPGRESCDVFVLALCASRYLGRLSVQVPAQALMLAQSLGRARESGRIL
jgi:hypothetical protein